MKRHKRQDKQQRQQDKRPGATEPQLNVPFAGQYSALVAVRDGGLPGLCPAAFPQVMAHAVHATRRFPALLGSGEPHEVPEEVLMALVGGAALLAQETTVLQRERLLGLPWSTLLPIDGHAALEVLMDVAARTRLFEYDQLDVRLVRAQLQALSPVQAAALVHDVEIVVHVIQALQQNDEAPSGEV